MSVCTGKGDGGFSSLSEGKTLCKSELCFQVLGNLDELSAALGLARAVGGERELLESFQQLLVKIMAYVSCREERFLLSQQERDIAKAHEEIAFSDFVMWGENELSARLNFARTVARRAERSYVRLNLQTPLDKGALVFLNRLSDALFVMACEAENKTTP